MRSLSSITDVSIHGGPCELYETEDYKAEVRAHRIEVTIDTVATRSKVYQVLRYMKKNLGRSLLTDISELGLQANDRLLPSVQLPDISRFETTPVPFLAVFWRGNSEARVIHPSPLLEILGLGIEHYAVDILHAWHLGGIQVFVGHVFWFMLKSKIWGSALSFLSTADDMRIALLRLKSELFSYYKDRRDSDPQWAKSGSTALEP